MEKKKEAYKRKIQQNDEELKRSKTSYEDNKTAQREEIKRLIKANKERDAEINKLKD